MKPTVEPMAMPSKPVAKPRAGNALSRHRAALCWVLAAAGTALGGCTSMGSAQSNSAVSTPGHQVRRLLVLANVEDQYFTKTHYAAFRTAFTEALKDCGTVVEHLHFDRLDLDWKKTVEGRLRAVNADSMLLFKNPGGGRVVQGGGGTNSDLNYESQLLDVRGKEVWRARTKFRFLSGNLFTVDKAGQGLGQAIANQMRKDALIGGCSGTATAAK